MDGFRSEKRETSKTHEASGLRPRKSHWAFQMDFTDLVRARHAQAELRRGKVGLCSAVFYRLYVNCSCWKIVADAGFRGLWLSKSYTTGSSKSTSKLSTAELYRDLADMSRRKVCRQQGRPGHTRSTAIDGQSTRRRLVPRILELVSQIATHLRRPIRE